MPSIRGERMKRNKNSLTLIILIVAIILIFILLGIFSHKTMEPEEDKPTEDKLEISESTLDKDGNLIIDIKSSKDKVYYLEKEKILVMNSSIVKNKVGESYFYITVKNITNEDIDLGENYSLVFYDNNDKEVDFYDGSVVGLVTANNSTICELTLSSGNISKVLFRKVN